MPDVWVGRSSLLPGHEARRRDRIAGRYTTGTVFIGPSGIGKSVLVNRFARRSVELGDVVLNAVRVAKRSDPLAQMAAETEQAANQVAGVPDVVAGFEALLKRLSIVSFKGVRVAVEQEDIANPHLVVRDALLGLATTLARENASRSSERQRALVVRIDELQNADNDQRSKLLSALGDVLEHEVELPDGGGRVLLPVVLYVTGLPDLLNRATNVDTFRRRFDTVPLSLFEDAEVIEALLGTSLPGGVTVAPDAARKLADVVAGDPYLFQLVGQAAWNASTSSSIGATDVEQADRETYSQRLRTIEAANDDIPAREAEVLDAIYTIAGDGLEARSGDVAAYLEVAPPKIASYAARLERRAAIQRDRGRWRVVHRLLRRYRMTGDII